MVPPSRTLAPAEAERYSRQLILKGIGLEGQMKLRDSRVLIVGAGGLGSPAAMYLAAAGVGHLAIADCDAVDLSNIQRQIIHGTRDIGTNKAVSASETLADLNPLVEVRTLTARITAENAPDLVAEYDAVLGCVDNMPTRYALNAACVDKGKPNIFGTISMYEGQASVFMPSGPCYRCFFRDPPPEGWQAPPEEKGILGTVPGIIGCIQATETVKALLGIGKTLAGRLLLFDALAMSFREIAIRKDPHCPVCGGKQEVLP